MLNHVFLLFTFKVQRGLLEPSGSLEKASSEHAGNVCLGSHGAMMCKYWGPVWERGGEELRLRHPESGNTPHQQPHRATLGKLGKK